MTFAVMTAELIAQMPDTTPEAPPAAAGFLKLVRYLMWFVMLSCFVGLIAVGGQIMWTRFHATSPPYVTGNAVNTMVGALIASSAYSLMDAVVF